MLVVMSLTLSIIVIFFDRRPTIADSLIRTRFCFGGGGSSGEVNYFVRVYKEAFAAIRAFYLLGALTLR